MVHHPPLRRNTPDLWHHSVNDTGEITSVGGHCGHHVGTLFDVEQGIMGFVVIWYGVIYVQMRVKIALVCRIVLSYY